MSSSKSSFGGSLNYSEYNYNKDGYQKMPSPPANAGLYTGEPFSKNAAYAPVQSIPDAGYMTNVQLRSSDMVVKPALSQYSSTTYRPGNNTSITDNVEQCSPNLGNIYCVANNRNLKK